MRFAVIFTVCTCVVLGKEVGNEVLVEATLSNDQHISVENNGNKDGYVLSPEQLAQIQALMQNAVKDEAVEEREVFEGTATQNNAFPGNLGGFKNINNMVEDQISSLLKSTGASLPEDIDSKLSPERIQNMLSWYNMAWLAFNLFMRYVFGEGAQGAIIVAIICFSLFFVAPWIWKKRKQRQMTNWLTKFYEEYAPENVIRVPNAVAAYSTLSNGFQRLKDDCTLKYVIDPKKTK